MHLKQPSRSSSPWADCLRVFELGLCKLPNDSRVESPKDMIPRIFSVAVEYRCKFAAPIQSRRPLAHYSTSSPDMYASLSLDESQSLLRISSSCDVRRLRFWVPFGEERWKRSMAEFLDQEAALAGLGA